MEAEIMPSDRCTKQDFTTHPKTNDKQGKKAASKKGCRMTCKQQEQRLLRKRRATNPNRPAKKEMEIGFRVAQQKSV